MTDAQKKANKKWDAANMVNVSCRLTRGRADEFKRACADRGTNVNAVLKKAVDDFIGRQTEEKD